MSRTSESRRPRSSSPVRVQTLPATAYLLNRDGEVTSLPLASVLPVKREGDLTAGGEHFSGQIDAMGIPAAVLRLGVLGGQPSVEGPMDQGRFHKEETQLLAKGQSARLVIEAPVKVFGGFLLYQIALRGLRRLVEDATVVQRAAQLDVLRMRPYQRARGAGTLAGEELALGNVGGVPDLFRNQAATAGGGFHDREQGFGGGRPPGGNLIMGALPRQ